MKLTIKVDCTPEEARAFFGLPNVTPVNDMIMDGIAKRTEENLEAFTDPKKFFEAAMASGIGNIEIMQQVFAAMAASATDASKADS